MKWSNNIKLSYTSLLLNKSRLMFSIIGMAVGISAVITTLSIGEGAKEKALGPIRSMGNNLLVINPAKTKEVFRDKQKPSTATTLRMKDIESLAVLDHLKYISPFQQISATVRNGGQSLKTLVQGVSEDYITIRDYKMKTGTRFSSEDNQSMARHAILGYKTAELLFADEDPIDKTIYINNIQFRVIGVLQLKGLDSEMGDIDNVAIIPIKPFLRRVSNQDYLGQIYISAEKQEYCTELEQGTRTILRENHRLDQQQKDDDFVIVNQLSSLKAAEESSKGFNILILGVASISLIIGGVGILALMVLAVKERIIEIGLRISIGAKKRQILWQFLSESLMIGIAGGTVGVIFGVIFSVLTNYFSTWETKLSFEGILLPFLFSILTGLVFGAIPAYRAANLDPVKALKSE
jgi:putative ABC transport system permease protein